MVVSHLEHAQRDLKYAKRLPTLRLFIICEVLPKVGIVSTVDTQCAYALDHLNVTMDPRNCVSMPLVLTVTLLTLLQVAYSAVSAKTIFLEENAPTIEEVSGQWC